MPDVCIALLSHVLNDAVLQRFRRLSKEAPTDHHVLFLLNTNDEPFDPTPDGGVIHPNQLTRSSWERLRQLPYPGKCRGEPWNMNGNSDLLFLTTWRLKPDHAFYWFVEYDVHYEGNWRIFFDYFRHSRADLLATIINPISHVSHKLDIMQPRISFPGGMGWHERDTVKAFLPICRLSQVALHGLDKDYRKGVVGHYELTVPTVLALRGLAIQDVGGRGPYVEPVNRNRFYFAARATYTHSPGTFVFRPPIRKVLARDNTLWHPVKPEDTLNWFPLRVRGGVTKTLTEWLKPFIYHQIIWLWFLLCWNPLSTNGRENGQNSRGKWLR